MRVIPLTDAHAEDWLRLRDSLWPHCSEDEHHAEMKRILSDPLKFAQFISIDDMGRSVGFVEASIRHDYVNGTSISPVAFLEGIYVEPKARQGGVARSLVQAVSTWATNRGMTELASDAAISNTLSHTMHIALGFEETERVVFFRKEIGGDDDA